MQFVCMDDRGRTEDWRTGDTTKLVAVLAALGIPVTTEKVWRDREGDERVTYLHGPLSLDPHRPGLPPAKELAKLYKTGLMQQTDPQHPLLDGLRSIANFLALRQWIEAGQKMELRLCAPERCLCAPGLDVPSIAHVDHVRTANLPRAAACALLGCAVLDITEPSAGKHVCTIANESEFLGAPTAAELITEHKSGKMLTTHPFAFAVEAVRAYLLLLKCVEDEITILMFKARKESRYGFVSEAASDAAKLRTDHFVAGIQ